MDVDNTARHSRQAGSSNGAVPKAAVCTVSGGHSRAGSGKAEGSGGTQAEVDKAEVAGKEAVSALLNSNGLSVKVVADGKDDKEMVGRTPAVERLKSRSVPKDSCCQSTVCCWN